MKKKNVRSLAAIAAQTTLLAVMLSLSACSSGGSIDGPEINPVTCDRGVVSDGVCVNASNCGGDINKCLDGFYCNSSNQCVARVQCQTEADCHQNPCVNGACINPRKCNEDSNCIPGDLCDLGQKKCVESPCPGGCSRGVCSVTEGRCENKEFCQIETEAVDCLEGNKCVNGACKDVDAFCKQLNCKRGTCSPEESKCVDKESCTLNSDCLAGNYCTKDGVCEKSKCKEGACHTEGGICNNETGECEEPTVCTSSEQCFKTHSCVKVNNIGQCKEDDQLCEPTCPGKQKCEYNKDTLTATCVEPDSCESSLDCIDRICENKACKDPSEVTCEADKYDKDTQSNDVVANATIFSVEQVDGAIDGLTLCGDDVDYFKVSVSDYPAPYGLEAIVEIEPEDVGSGTVELSILNDNAVLIGGEPATNKKDDGTYSTTITNIQNISSVPGSAFILVERKGSTNRVRYKLKLQKINVDEYQQCKNATSIEFAQNADGALTATKSGTTAEDESTGKAINLSCAADPNGEISDAIYQFTLDEPKFLEITAAATSTSNDIALALRSSCASELSELKCVDAEAAGTTEKIEGVYPAGTYTLIVTSKDKDKTGAFELTLSAKKVVCQPSERECLPDGKTLRRCNASQTEVEEVACAQSCNAETAQCLEDLGTSCLTAIPVSQAQPFSAQVGFKKEQKSIDLSGNCGVTASNTKGADVIFKVTVPDGLAVRAQMGDITQYRNSALYVLDTCEALPTTCLAAADENSSRKGESLAWVNNTGAEKVVYVVADGADPYSVSSLPTDQQVDIEVVQLSCTPGDARCYKNRTLETCDAVGSGYTVKTDCSPSSGCDSSVTPNVCLPPKGDSCESAINITNRTLKHQELIYAKSVYAKPVCADGDAVGYSADDSPELVYYIEANPDEAVSINVKPSDDFDPRIWMFESCETTSTPATECTYNIDASESDGVEEFHTFISSHTTGKKRYYFAVESGDYSTSANASFEITGTAQVPQCNGKPECEAGKTTIKYCNELGVTFRHDCGTNGCSNDPVPHCNPGATNAPTGNTCVDPIILDRGNIGAPILAGEETGKFNDTGLTNEINMHGDYSVVGQCMLTSSYYSPDEAETVYAVKLDTLDTIEVELETTNTYAQLYILTDCFQTQTCHGLMKNSPKQVSYHAESDEFIYIVVDAHNKPYSTPVVDYKLKWKITQSGTCVDSTRKCTTENELSYCHNGAMVNISCHCVEGACRPDTSNVASIPGNTCDPTTIVNLGTGGVVVLDKSDYMALTNDKEPTCAGTPKGKDYFVKVFAQAGDIITVKGVNAGYSKPAVYIFEDCADLETSCLSGSNKTNQSDETKLVYYVTDAKDYYIGLDVATSATNNNNLIYYSIEVAPPLCQQGEVRCETDSSSNKGQIQVCNQNQYETVFECPGACGTTVGSCSSPTGEFWTDAIALANPNPTPNTAIDVNLNNKVDTSGTLTTAEGEGFTYGSCVFNGRPTGNDVYYKVDLAANEILDVTLSGMDSTKYDDRSVQLYLMGPESGANTSKITCIINDPDSGSQDPRKIKFQAYTAGTYYIVVDTTSKRTITEPLKLKYHVTTLPTSTTCLAMSAQCKTNTQLEVCNQDGSAKVTYDCPNGCSGRACLSTSDSSKTQNVLDTCSAPSPSLTAISKSFMGTLDLKSTQITDSVQANSGSSGCNLSSTTASDNSDIFYPLDLQQNDSVSVYVQRASDSRNIMAYVFDDCGDVSTTTNTTTCAGGGALTQSSYSLERVPLNFIAPQQGTYYLAIDSNSYLSTSSSSILFYVDIKQKECDPTNASVECLVAPATPSGNLKICEPAGFYSYYECSSQTCNATTATCDNPDGNACLEAYESFATLSLTNSPLAVTGSYSNQTKNNHDMCGSPYKARGTDAFYKIHLLNGETIEATLTPSATDEDVTLAIFSSTCGCLEVKDAGIRGAKEKISYKNDTGAAQDYFIVVDAYTSEAKGGYTLEASITN